MWWTVCKDPVLGRYTQQTSLGELEISINGATSKWRVYNRKSHQNKMILGVPLFQETSNWALFLIGCTRWLEDSKADLLFTSLMSILQSWVVKSFESQKHAITARCWSSTPHGILALSIRQDPFSNVIPIPRWNSWKIPIHDYSDLLFHLFGDDYYSMVWFMILIYGFI